MHPHCGGDYRSTTKAALIEFVGLGGEFLTEVEK
jgi:hypothetical protein